MATLTISVPDDMADFVYERIKETQHVSATEYIRSLIDEDRRLREQRCLEEQLLQGFGSGAALVINNLDEHFARKKNDLLARMKQASRP